MTKHKTKGLAEIVASYQNNRNQKRFKPENFLELGRIFGPEAVIDMNRLTCQHRADVASAYMRRIRKNKADQQDVYFKKLQNIPITIRRVAVEKDYQDPYTSFKNRLPKLGQDPKMRDLPSRRVISDGNKYMPHNTITPHVSILFKMNPDGYIHKGIKPLPNIPNTKSPRDNDPDESPSPRKQKHRKNMASEILQNQIRKRLSVDFNSSNKSSPRDLLLGFNGENSMAPSVDHSPRAPSNSPRHNKAFWSFNVPTELNNSNRKSHFHSIPQAKNALAAIRNVQMHNKPMPTIVVKV